MSYNIFWRSMENQMGDDSVSSTFNKMKPDHEVALAEQDPLAIITENMEERGFGIGQLWTESDWSLTKFTDPLKREYLRVYATTGRHAFSAATCGLSRSLVSRHRTHDPVFAAACEEAEEYFRDLLKAEMFRRGVTGFKKQVLGGRERNEVIEIVEYSDKAMELLARVHLPAMQKKQIEVKGSVDNSQISVTQNVFDPTTMPPDELKLFKELLLKQAKRQKEADLDAGALEGVLDES